VRAPQRGGAEDELEAVGQEHRHERPRRDVGEALDRGAVDGQPLGLAGLEADGDLVRAQLVLRAQHEPAHRRAEPQHLALVGRPARAARAREVHALEQVRLAGAVAARDHRQPRAEPQLRLLVGAEVAQLQPRGVHGGARR
jgi:hypothetical protein